jgi:hypothetical protein
MFITILPPPCGFTSKYTGTWINIPQRGIRKSWDSIKGATLHIQSEAVING